MNGGLDIQNESDVEQKVIYPLLTGLSPNGLGLPPASVKTKPNLRRYAIGKGSERKVYFPDYLVVISGLPVLVVEAKGVDEDLTAASREARLYAAELNASFPSSVNPAAKYLCANDRELIIGNWDSETPVVTIAHDELHAGSEAFAQLLDLVSATELEAFAESVLRELSPKNFERPINLLGGVATRDEELSHNSFGDTIAIDYRHLFNPTNRRERAYIVRNAYIPSKRRERYLEPIDRIIRAALPPSHNESNLIEDTSRPDEVIRSMEDLRALEHQILLLIGGVGCGKSTFVDYLREVALPPQILEATVWTHLDMNNAPMAPDRLYRWMCNRISQELTRVYPEIDFDALDTIEKVYSTELSRLRKGALSLLDPESTEYKARLTDEIIRMQRDEELTAKALSRYLCAERAKLQVVVLDNSDKRVRDAQLLVFEAAQWVQKEFNCLVVLPIRDVTYDNHRNEPPLDTAIKDLVFRIEAPPFQKVLSRRMAIAFHEMKLKSESNTLSFDLPNGMRVEYPASDQAYFLTSILKSIFEHERFVRRVVVGLAGNDIRKAMEIFLEICKSGHIREDDILRIRAAEGQYTLRFHDLARVLLRINRRFYDGDYSYIKNVFQSEPDDDKPNHFLRIGILRWLHARFRTKGPSGVVGYHPVKALGADLVALGAGAAAVQRELAYLLRARCIVAEHLRTDQLDAHDLVSLTPSGYVHIQLTTSIDYLAAIAEDTWITDAEIARGISERISDRDRQYTFGTVIENAKAFVDHLSDVSASMMPSPSIYLRDDEWQMLVDMNGPTLEIDKIMKRQPEILPWLGSRTKFPIGSILVGTVVKNHEEHGLFVEVAPGVTGLVHRSTLEGIAEHELEAGSSVQVEVKYINERRKRMSLLLCSPN